MSSTKTPTSSLSAIELLTKRIWYRSLAIIRETRSEGASPEIPTTRLSPVTKFPQDIVEMIITHLIYDKPSLRACSLTCYSWYITAVPHLHHTLVIDTHDPRYRRFRWPNIILHKHMLGLLPLVKKLHILARVTFGEGEITPKMFRCYTLLKFSALTNVQELGIEFLNISKFMPRLQRYFGNFLPTVRSLALRSPRGSHRQIIYFIGLFQHLQDLKLIFNASFGFISPEEAPVGDLTLVPPFVPPLRGRLTMTLSRTVELLEDMIWLFGGIRFRSMDLFDVNGTRLLLNACVETLETLRLHQNDPRAGPSFRDFDLSRHKSLRTLEVPASSIVHKEPGILTHVLSTITSPAFSEVIIIYRDYDFGGLYRLPDTRVFREMLPVEREEDVSFRRSRLEALHEMYKVRAFRPVLCADVWDRVREYTVWELKQAVTLEREFDDFFSKLSVISVPRGSLPPLVEQDYAYSHIPWLPL